LERSFGWVRDVYTPVDFDNSSTMTNIQPNTSKTANHCSREVSFEDISLCGKFSLNLERRSYGSIDTLASTTTVNQRRDRRRELEEKYGVRSAVNNPYRAGAADPGRTFVSLDDSFVTRRSSRNSSIENVVQR
jgi:hypothetical protein